MGEQRRALIIAVPQHDLNERFPDLTPTVRKDAELLAGALKSSGFDVEFIGLTPDRPALKSRIRAAISRICCTAPEDGTVLVHFTGHGLLVGETDHLVPADAQLSWATDPPEVDPGSLLPLDPSDLLKGCRAGTVLFTIDACRDPDASSTGDREEPGITFPGGRDRVAVLFGCGPGQTCGSDEEQGSHFTRALADALDADTAPRTVEQVIAHTIRRTTEFARAAQEEQNPTPRYPPCGPAPIAKVELCTGRTLQQEWTKAVGDPQLWAAVRCGEDRRTGLQEALVRLTTECAQWCGSVPAALRDPWADEDYPVRVLSRGLRPLLAPSQTEGAPLLDAGEFAILAAAPFIREAVYAMGVKEALRVDPFQLEPATSDAGRIPERVDLEHIFAAHSLIWRKGRELARRARYEEADAVAAWLMHRHVSGKEELWERYAPQLLTPLAKAVLGADAAGPRIGELTDEFLRICRQTALVPAQPHMDEPETPWRLDKLVCSGDTETERWRPRELSWLIAVAGLLGGDLRDLPGVLVDNVGVTDGLVPARAVESVRDLRWTRDGFSRTLDLDLQCPHPAVHSALETLTAWTDDAVQHIRRHVGPAEPTGPLRHLPERVTCGRLRPQYDPAIKGDAYGVPLMRFGLAEDEVRELLMGTQLYGDRNLALRELYQNALDACRYRKARRRYGEIGRRIPYTWEGEIVFRQGVDAGRHYVECQDNGVGMGRETLRSTFARAGRRFEQSRDYRSEQSRWRRADPDLRIYPNSRFGVGVFSYFMLADEISIWTRPTDEYGREIPGQGLRVDIASSGSLFRIRPSEEAEPGGGTRVRLYLQADDVDVAKVLGRQIWRSDFAMRVERDGDVCRRWQPDTLYYEGDHTVPARAGRDMWWVPGPGYLLADGVAVDKDPWPTWRGGDVSEWLDRGEENNFGWVVDLRETHAPELSTDRTRLLSHDEEWVDSQLISAGEDFVPPEWFTMEWLWAFARSHPAAAETITRRLLTTDARIASKASWDRSGLIDLSEVGCFPADTGLVAVRDSSGRLRTVDGPSVDHRIIAWRAAVLRAARVELAFSGPDRALPESTEGYPGPQPWQAAASYDEWDSFFGVLLAAVQGTDSAPFTFGRLLQRLRRYAIVGLPVPAVPDLETAHGTLLDSVDRAILVECALLVDDRNSREYGVELISQWGSEEGAEDLLVVLSRFSMEGELPLHEALGRARRFAAVGFELELPADVTEPLPDLVATRADLRALALHPRFAGATEIRYYPPPPRAEYEEVVGRYSSLGLTIEPPIPDPPESERCSAARSGWLPPRWPEEQKQEFEQCFGVSRFVEGSRRLTLRQLARASGVLSISVAAVIDRYAEAFRSMGLSVPDAGEPADRVFDRLDSDLLGAAQRPQLQHEAIDAWTTPAPLFDTAVMVESVQADTERVVRSLTGLVAAGLVDARALDLVEDWRALSKNDWKLLPRHSLALSGSTSAEGEFTDDDEELEDRLRLDVVYGFRAAADTFARLDSVFGRLALLGPKVGLDTSGLQAPLPASLAGVRPTRSDATACCTKGARRWQWRACADVRALVEHARTTESTLGQSLTSLSRYAPLGAPWREIDDDPAAPWRDHHPTQHDSEIFETDLVGDRPAGALDLLRVAARFGWPIDQAWDRLALYRPLGLELLVERPESGTVPVWEDLILLTEEYTGRAPALSGPLSTERIAVAAREVERPTGWVWERLTRYASLFGLELPSMCPAEPAPFPPAVPYRNEADQGGAA